MSNNNASITSVPSGKPVAITASDSTSITGGPVRGILVATAGNYDLLCPGNTVVVPVYLAAGIIHPIRVTRVNSTNAASTSAIVGFM
jgi:hypothetical protein